MAADDIHTIAEWACEVMEWPLDPATVEVVRLEAGYSWQTSRVRTDQGSVIVRVAPRGGTVEPYDAAAEAAVIGAAGIAGIPVPEILAVDEGERFGTPASMQTDVAGSVVRPGHEVAAGDAADYRTTFATTLAAIHTRMPVDGISIEESYRRKITDAVGHYTRCSPSAHPGFEIGRMWLLANVPGDDRPAVQCHGDYRLTNLLWSDVGRLAAVLDWERAWTGDPMCDVAFTRMFSGWCSIAGEAAAGYTAASGIEVDEDRLHYATLFERWRSFTAAMRGLNAYIGGRNDDERLVRIGLAGEAGAWHLTPLLAEVPANQGGAVHTQGEYVSPAANLGARWEHVAAADAAALGASLDALEAVADELTAPTLRVVDPEAAYRETHAAVLAALPERGAGLLPHLQALAMRATLRFEILEETGWH
jgi:aminoglycoside phosphotransferase (APT) family kinase protein